MGTCLPGMGWAQPERDKPNSSVVSILNMQGAPATCLEHGQCEVHVHAMQYWPSGTPQPESGLLVKMQNKILEAVFSQLLYALVLLECTSADCPSASHLDRSVTFWNDRERTAHCLETK